jgi:wyosine [tRNA(Phe)-imidazoG37] synthetase (radical SAM superfamily)
MDTPCIYEIRVEGHLADRWSEWFEGLAICNELNGETTLRGTLVDQAALFGVLAKIHDLSLVLVSVHRILAEAS